MALKLGINLGYWGIGPAGEDAVEVVQAAERAGFESVWAAESYGSDVVSVLAWLAPQTSTIKLGAAIMQVPARPPAAAAMAGATIDKLSGGRFIFGFGPSGPQVSEGWYGVPYAKPWGRTREYIEVVREIIAREGPVDHQGEHYQLPLPGGEGKALKLNFHPDAQPDPRLRRRDRPQIGGDGGGDLRRLDPDLLQRRRLRADLGRAPGGGLRQGRAAALRPRGLALAAGGDRRRPGGGEERRQGGPRPLLRRHGQPQDQLLRRPGAPLRLRRRRRRGAAPLPGRRPRRRLRGDARRDRRGDLAGRDRGRGGGADRALPRRRHRPADRLPGPRRQGRATPHAGAPRGHRGRPRRPPNRIA